MEGDLVEFSGVDESGNKNDLPLPLLLLPESTFYSEGESFRSAIKIGWVAL